MINSLCIDQFILLYIRASEVLMGGVRNSRRFYLLKETFEKEVDHCDCTLFGQTVSEYLVNQVLTSSARGKISIPSLIKQE